MSYWSSYVCSADLGAKGTVISAEEPIPSDITITTIRDGGAPVTETVTIAPVAPTNDSETRHLYGIEATASHAFTWLPDPLDGLGVQGSVNRAFANFEYPDTSPIADYVDPANLIGLSKWTASGRSEEHTSELQSLMRTSYAVFCLQKKKHRNKNTIS